MARELNADQVYRRFDPAQLGFNTTAELTPREGIVGQDRAVRALRFGLDIRQAGIQRLRGQPSQAGR